MKTGFDYRIGPGMSSLMMIFVVLCMAVLAVLTLAVVQVDSVLNEKSAAATLSYYQAAVQVQRDLKALDAELEQARADSNGDVAAYVDRLMTLGQGGGAVIDEDSGEWMIRIVVPMGADRQLEALVTIPKALEGERYRLVSHQAQVTSPWDAPESIGYYQRPE